MTNCKNQIAYYWRHREDILARHAERTKDPEYKKHRAEIALKSYYKRKEEKTTYRENLVKNTQGRKLYSN